MGFALTVFRPLKELALSCIRIGDQLLAQISCKQWAELGKAGGQRYWKQSSAMLKHLQEGLMKTLASYRQTPQQSFPIHPVALISCRIQQYSELVNLQCDFSLLLPSHRNPIQYQRATAEWQPLTSGSSSNI